MSHASLPVRSGTELRPGRFLHRSRLNRWDFVPNVPQPQRVTWIVSRVSCRTHLTSLICNVMSHELLSVCDVAIASPAWPFSTFLWLPRFHGSSLADLEAMKLWTMLRKTLQRKRNSTEGDNLFYMHRGVRIKTSNSGCQSSAQAYSNVPYSLNLFPANVPTREHDFFSIFSRFHIENDVILRILWLNLKNVPKYPFVGGKQSVFCFRHYYFHKVSKKTTKSLWEKG